MPEQDRIIAQTQCWLDSVIIEHNLCPFAKSERDRGSIHFFVDDSTTMEQVLEQLVMECERLEQNTDIETSLFIMSHIAQDFSDYLLLLDIANELFITQGYEGIFQLASFHPDYQFADTTEEEPANYTNRSPYPMLHIIREASLERALQHYPDPELIPQRNVALCRKMGLTKMQALLAHCQHQSNSSSE